MLNKLSEKWADQLYAVFRILVGVLFVQHGLQKIFGLFGGQAQSLVSLMGLAGIIELVGGLLLALGLLTRWAALVSGIQMIVAYIMVHAPQGWVPLVNKGELALLYLAAFLAILAYGAGTWSLDQALSGK